MSSWLRTSALVIVLIATYFTPACNSSHDERAIVPTSEPRVACALAEGPRGSTDAKTAIVHAQATWAAIHEKDPSNETSAPAYIARFEPYTATLRDGVWHVQGTIPPGFQGYVPVMSVCKNDEGASAGSTSVP
jgi:hypothetical protein